MSLILVSLIAVLAGTGYNAYPKVAHKYQALGIGNSGKTFANIHGDGLVRIPNTMQCEDLHHHLSSNLLFTACEDESISHDARRHWFPPLAHFDDKWAIGRGRIVVVDPEKFTSYDLELVGFQGPFVTHGIDIWEDPDDSTKLHIFAVNHLPDPEAASKTIPTKARSQIEIFEHTIGTKYAKWIRSVYRNSVITPNDIIITGPNSFYVTNDHHYRNGPLRIVEEAGWRGLAGWTNILHVAFNRNPASLDAAEDVNAVVALTGLHNNNGLGRGAFPGEVVVCDASGGEMTRTTMTGTKPGESKLKVLEHIKIGSTIDNPSFYQDDYATPDNDASGYVLAGLSRAIALAGDVQDPKARSPTLVWHVRLNDTYQAGKLRKEDEGWDKNLIFRDDGNVLSTASAAVLVGIDPKKTGGKKQAWLFATGFLSEAMVATRVDL